MADDREGDEAEVDELDESNEVVFLSQCGEGKACAGLGLLWLFLSSQIERFEER